MSPGFAADEHALVERRALAQQLVGRRVVRVQYVDIDYRGWDLGYHEQDVRRQITNTDEWREPTWDAGSFHHADFGVELAMASGDIWGITWDVTAREESLTLRPGEVAQNGAVWDVTAREPWSDSITSVITGVDLQYRPWPPGFWCSRVSLHFGTTRVEVLLGDRDQSGMRLEPSADNIAVLLDPEALPDWERTDDTL